MLFDTGAYRSMMTEAAAEKFGLPLDTTGGYTMGVGGASVAYAVKLNDFSVGPAHSGKMLMHVLGHMGSEAEFDAVAGGDFAFQADLEIDLKGRQFKFYRNYGCTDSYLAYWSPDAMEIPFGGTDTGHPNPRLIVEINGTKMEAEIDTGAMRTSMTRKAAERAGIVVGDAGVARAGSASGIGAKRVDYWSTEAEFTIGSETIKNASIGIRDNSPLGETIAIPDVLIGADFLRAHRVLVAMSQKRFYISYVGGEVFAKRQKRDD